MDDNPPSLIPERIGVALSVVLFGVPALVLWLATAVLVPALTAGGWEPLLAWFAAGTLALAPLFAAAILGAYLASRVPSLPGILEHLRVRRLSAADWRLAGSTLIFAFAATAGLYVLNANVWPGLPPQPHFMAVQPLVPAQYYILALWLPFFAVNIIGEELWWRGFIQPRQERVFGRGTWIVQGLLHGAFHFSLGPGVMFLLLPLIFSIPWAVQRSRNTSVGIVVHAGVNGPAFLAIALGLMPGG